jgi:nitrogen fixation-related uncharacterized protein
MTTGEKLILIPVSLAAIAFIVFCWWWVEDVINEKY